MTKDYQDWCYLNDDGMKDYGDIFPTTQVPILSMIPIMFEHPQLDEPKKAYLLRGSDLTEEQIEKLIEKASKKFDEFDKEEMRTHILTNQVPIRAELTSGAGTKRIFMYMPDFDEEQEGMDEDSDREDELDWERNMYDPWES